MYVDIPVSQFSILTEVKGSQEEGMEWTKLIVEFVGLPGDAASGCLRELRRSAEELDPLLGSEYRVGTILRVPSQLN